jgi:hypothetical protein
MYEFLLYETLNETEGGQVFRRQNMWKGEIVHLVDTNRVIQRQFYNRTTSFPNFVFFI